MHLTLFFFILYFNAVFIPFKRSFFKEIRNKNNLRKKISKYFYKKVILNLPAFLSDVNCEFLRSGNISYK